MNHTLTPTDKGIFMRSNLILPRNKTTINAINDHGKEPWESVLWNTPADFLAHYNGIKDKKNCNEFINIAELSILLRLKISTIYNYNCDHPERLPERVKGRKDLVWRVSAVDRFMTAALVTPTPPAPAPAPAPAPVPAPVPVPVPVQIIKRGPGRPRNLSLCTT
jgi:predicted DNA-binding transcriptional regulator AlpA